MRVQAFILFLALCIAQPLFADWQATLKLPYNAPPYVKDWSTGKDIVAFTLANRSDAPQIIVVEMSVSNDAGAEIFHGSDVPFLILNNNPTVLFTPEIIRWGQIEWNPLFRRTNAEPNRLPEGNINVCVRVYAWQRGKGAQLAEACGKTFVDYPDVPQIMSPSVDAHITDMPIKFTWQPLDVPVNIVPHYVLEIAEIPQSVSADSAIVGNTIQFVPSKSGVFQLTPDNIQLRRGAAYAWRISALDQYGNPVTAHNGVSRTGRFFFEQESDFQKQRALADAKKNAANLMDAALGASGNSQTLAALATAKSKLPNANLFTTTEIVKSLSPIVDSSANAGIDPKSVIDVIDAQFVLGYALEVNEGKYPMVGTKNDSLLALSIHRFEALSRIGGEQMKSVADSLAGNMKARRIQLNKPVNNTDLLAIAIGFSKFIAPATPASAALVEQSETAYADFIQNVWEQGGDLTKAYCQVLRIQNNAPKNLRTQVDQVESKIREAMGTGSVADCRAAGHAVDAARQAKGASAIDGDMSAIAENIAQSISHAGSSVQNQSTSQFTDLADALQSAANSASKKGGKEILSLAEQCRSSTGDAASQEKILDNVEADLQRLMKSEKSATALQAIVTTIDNLKPMFAQTSVFDDITQICSAAVAEQKDATLKSIAKKIADNCHSISADAQIHPLSPEDAVHRSQEIIVDGRVLDRMNGKSEYATQVTLLLASRIIAPNLMTISAMHDANGMLVQNNLTLGFGETEGNRYAERKGAELLLNVVLASEPPPVLNYFITSELLGGSSETLESAYQHACASANGLMKNAAAGLNARADFSLDESILGEQETKRLLRALPELTNVADH